LNGTQREVTIKGIIKSKVDQISMAVYMLGSEERAILGRDDYNVGQIAIRLAPGTDSIAFRDLLIRSGLDESALIETFDDAIPNGVEDIKNTFAMLGNGFSSIGLVVASITIFIVIFINALTRRKFIGILKGIGVSGAAIEIAYLLQSLFYALLGSAVGLAVLYGFLVPYVNVHPIDFPFADGIIYAPLDGTLIRMGLLVFATLIAGYIPARMIVKRNTLDSILGRN
jgi:ABC-type antimicrobial peptide transport system permease subunit